MGRRIDVKADDVLELVSEFRIVGDLEAAHPMRLQSLPRPDPPHRGRADPHCRSHRRRRPMGRGMRRRLVGQRHHPIDRRRRQRRDPRRPRLVAGKPRDPLVHKALLPAPDHGLAFANRPHDRDGAVAIGRQHHDPGAPDVLLRAVAIPDDRLQARPIRRRDIDGDPLAHAAQSHKLYHDKTVIWTLPSGPIH